jgi:polyphenol oxidase
MHPDWIVPDWPAPAHVRAIVTTRTGGVSSGPYAGHAGYADGMNVGLGSGDDPASVGANRALLAAMLPSEPRWLRQMHGAQVVEAATVLEPVAADAAYTCQSDVIAAVMVADCMPVFLTDAAGRCVGVAHAGWRGLAAGILQNTVRSMRAALDEPQAELMAYLGPAIGPRHFEVGPEVRQAMLQRLPDAASAFTPHVPGKYLADLAALASQALRQVKVTALHGAEHCTFSDARRFYSHRRDRVTGRHAALIWRSPGKCLDV